MTIDMSVNLLTAVAGITPYEAQTIDELSDKVIEELESEAEGLPADRYQLFLGDMRRRAGDILKFLDLLESRGAMPLQIMSTARLLFSELKSIGEELARGTEENHYQYAREMSAYEPYKEFQFSLKELSPAKEHHVPSFTEIMERAQHARAEDQIQQNMALAKMSAGLIRIGGKALEEGVKLGVCHSSPVNQLMCKAAVKLEEAAGHPVEKALTEIAQKFQSYLPDNRALAHELNNQFDIPLEEGIKYGENAFLVGTTMLPVPPIAKLVGRFVPQAARSAFAGRSGWAVGTLQQSSSKEISKKVFVFNVNNQKIGNVEIAANLNAHLTNPIHSLQTFQWTPRFLKEDFGGVRLPLKASKLTGGNVALSTQAIGKLKWMSNIQAEKKLIEKMWASTPRVQPPVNTTFDLLLSDYVEYPYRRANLLLKVYGNKVFYIHRPKFGDRLLLPKNGMGSKQKFEMVMDGLCQFARKQKLSKVMLAWDPEQYAWASFLQKYGIEVSGVGTLAGKNASTLSVVEFSIAQPWKAASSMEAKLRTKPLPPMSRLPTKMPNHMDEFADRAEMKKILGSKLGPDANGNVSARILYVDIPLGRGKAVLYHVGNTVPRDTFNIVGRLYSVIKEKIGSLECYRFILQSLFQHSRAMKHQRVFLVFKDDHSQRLIPVLQAMKGQPEKIIGRSHPFLDSQNQPMMMLEINVNP